MVQRESRDLLKIRGNKRTITKECLTIILQFIPYLDSHKYKDLYLISPLVGFTVFTLNNPRYLRTLPQLDLHSIIIKSCDLSLSLIYTSTIKSCDHSLAWIYS